MDFLENQEVRVEFIGKIREKQTIGNRAYYLIDSLDDGNSTHGWITSDKISVLETEVNK
jgi:hypothetical protein